MGILLFIISALPVVLLGLFIYKKDKDREPLKLLAKLFLAGILSCFLVLFVSVLLSFVFPIFGADSSDLNLLELIIYAFIAVALVEEFCKFIMVYFISYNDSHFDEIYDVMVYSVFVSLGFAFFENLIYVYGNGIETGILRAITAVPGHAFDGVFMGYYLGVAKLATLNNRNDLKAKNIILSLIVPTLLHGFYDYCAFSGVPLFVLVFYAFVVMLYVMSLKKIKQVSAISRRFEMPNKYCSRCGNMVNTNYCSNCGTKNE